MRPSMRASPQQKRVMTCSLKAGDVVAYPYLWRREADKGETEGRKTRPTVVVVPLEMNGKTYLYLLAITSKRVSGDQAGVEIPALELRRIGLSSARPGWVIVSEHNRDIAGESYHLSPDAIPLGRFSSRFENVILKAAAAHLRRPAALVVRSP